MPVYSTPPADAIIPTKKVSHPEWATEGPYEEHFEILSYLRGEVLKNARTTATTTITERGKTREEVNDDVFFRVLFDTQLKGWRLLNPDGTDKLYTPGNIATLPLELKNWLAAEIVACNGIIPTRELVIKLGDSGQTLDYKRPDDLMDSGPEPQVPDPQ